MDANQIRYIFREINKLASGVFGLFFLFYLVSDKILEKPPVLTMCEATTLVINSEGVESVWDGKDRPEIRKNVIRKTRNLVNALFAPEGGHEGARIATNKVANMFVLGDNALKIYNERRNETLALAESGIITQFTVFEENIDYIEKDGLWFREVVGTWVHEDPSRPELAQKSFNVSIIIGYLEAKGMGQADDVTLKSGKKMSLVARVMEAKIVKLN